MTEEVNQEVVQENKPDPVVERALQMGWKPETDWEGDPVDFVDAKEFINRQPLFDKIEHQSKELRQLRQAFDALRTHHSKVKEVEYTRALAALKAEKRRALTEGETERALIIEDKMEEIQEQKTQFDNDIAQVSPQEISQPRPEFVRWSQENSWYGKDRAMTAFADKLGVELAQEGRSPADVLTQVTKEIRQEFKHKFENNNRQRAGAVESGTRRGANTESEFAMNDDERRIMNRILQAGGLTKEQYIAELKKVRG